MLALAVIVKDQIEEMYRIVKDYGQYFDEIVFAVDNDAASKIIIEDKKVRIYKYEWTEEEKEDGCPHFANKRNFLASKINSDYYMRIDTDDAIIGAENIRRVYDLAKASDISIVYCRYLYSKDDYGATNAEHDRETIIKKSDNLVWKKSIHENILAKDMLNFKIQHCTKIVIDHKIDDKHALESGLRNIKALLKEYNKDTKNPDPRTVAYLGRMFFSAKDFDRAIFFLEKHIETSGWDEDRYMSWCYLCEAFRMQGNYKNALSCCFEALQERPDFPDAYAKLHDVYVDKKDYKKALEWGVLALNKPQPKTFMLKDPSALGWRLYLSMSFCYIQADMPDEALKLFLMAKKQVPELDFIKKNEKWYKDSVLHKQFLEHFMWLFYFIKDKAPNKMESLIDCVPKELCDNAAIIKIKNMFGKKKKFGDKHIAIFCGNTSEEWADPSVLQGIGGSESAVIYASRELVKKGYEVTVYSNCGDMEGEYKGVKYKQFYEFSPNDEYNIVISWRVNIFQLHDIVAKQRIMWLHDLPQERDFANVDCIDKIMVLSEYHKSLLPKHVPEEKIFVSTNGINEKDFSKIVEIKRQPKRIIYASSYDRGLETILDNWSTIRKEVPEAELHCFYGWNMYKELEDAGWKDPSYRLGMIKKMEQEGIYEHGRVGHKKLLKEYCKSSVYAYPCIFEGEIQCIALTKAIACNCNIVTNDFAVMQERSPNAVKDKDFIQELIKTLQKPTVDKLNKEYIKSMSWEKVVDGWANELFSV